MATSSTPAAKFSVSELTPVRRTEMNRTGIAAASAIRDSCNLALSAPSSAIPATTSEDLPTQIFAKLTYALTPIPDKNIGLTPKPQTPQQPIPPPFPPSLAPDDAG